MSKYILILICCGLSALSCTQPNNQPMLQKQKELVLDSLYSFQLDAQEIIGNIHDHHGIKADSKGERFLFADRGKNQILVSDSLGNVETVIGQTGRGPKEFLSIDGINFLTDSTIFVFDDDLKKTTFFKLNGELYHSFKYKNDDYFFTSPDYVSKNSKIYTSILEAEYVPFSLKSDFEQVAKSKILIALDTAGKDLGKMGKYDTLTPFKVDYFIAQILGANSQNNKVYINQISSPIIQFYDTKTGIFGVFSDQIPKNYIQATEPISSQVSRNRVKEMSAGRTYAERLVPLNEYLFKSMDKLTEEWNITQDHLTKTNILVVYDKDGNIVAEKVLEGKRLFGGHGNKLYFLTDNNPDNFTIQVATYRLVEK